ncbi:hypothetical protein GBAR_LOCUS13146 [Geodia barretti]|uniref:Ferritin-like domain-containing protein n=1 Tax=Geodia barretti TaxID=519541 RepID=A0AA35WPX3_GEOBA|nr:hypothetical protein GBAR_LOCUS13146 [Geodia barretti]
MATNKEEKSEQPQDQQSEESSNEALETPARPSLDWMNDTLQWGTKVPPGKHGITIGDLQVGVYGDIPEVSTDMTRRPRGAFPIPGIPRTDLYALSAKVDIWADNAADLYEEAIQRRWMAHADVPWDDLAPLPDDVELAMRQLCTELAQQASLETDVIGQWLHRMNYAYYEVKAFLATEIFDTGRHFVAFRQRALANGGKLGLESPGHFNRRLMEARAGWTEVAIYLYIIRGTLTQLVLRYAEAYAQSPAEKYLFRKCLEDKARHVAYGLAHVKYAVENSDPSFGLGLNNLMRAVEGDLSQEMQDPVIWEALAIIFGGGVSNMVEGMEVVKGLQQRFIEQYLARMKWVGIPKTEANLNPGLAVYLRREEATPA